eukprot:RCo041942
MQLSPAAVPCIVVLLFALGSWGYAPDFLKNEGLQYESVCPYLGPGTVRCHASVLTYSDGSSFDPTRHSRRIIQPAADPGPLPSTGWNAADLREAYGIPVKGVTRATVAIVMGCDDPYVEDDLTAYRTANNIPLCTSANGCFRKLNQNGDLQPFVDCSTHPAEVSLDTQMVSAVCPECKILLVLADSMTLHDLYIAVATAVKNGATVVSMSFGGEEEKVEPSVFGTPGVAFFASSGDWGYNQLKPVTDSATQTTTLRIGVQTPAAFPNVVAVGGTVLSRSGNARKWSEVAWKDAGCGCSQYFNKVSLLNLGCGERQTIADVSAVASGVNIVVNGTWKAVSGTSVSAPVVASIFALTGHGNVASNWPYLNRNLFLDITSGAVNTPPYGAVTGTQAPPYYGTPGNCTETLLCNGQTGYDGPTGLGVWYPVGLTCASFFCPVGFIANNATTVCLTSLSSCTREECCTQVYPNCGNSSITCPYGSGRKNDTVICSSPSCSTDDCCIQLTSRASACLAMSFFADCMTVTKEAFVQKLAAVTGLPSQAIVVTFWGCAQGIVFLTALGETPAEAENRLTAIQMTAWIPGVSLISRGELCEPPVTTTAATATPDINITPSNPALLGLLVLLVIPIAELGILMWWSLRKPVPQPVPVTTAGWNPVSLPGIQTGRFLNVYLPATTAITTAPAAVTSFDAAPPI